MTRRLAFVLLLILCIAPCLSAQAPPSKNSPATQPSPSSPPAPTGTIQERVEQFLRNVYAWGPQFELKVGATKLSPLPEILEVPITITMDGQSDTATVYVSKDGKYIVRGDITDMTLDPFAENRTNLHIGTSPFKGPAGSSPSRDPATISIPNSAFLRETFRGRRFPPWWSGLPLECGPMDLPRGK